MNCLNCGKEVVSKGTKPAKYCSDRCRKAWARAIAKYKDDLQADKRTEETDTPESIVKHIAKHGGTATYKTDKGKVQDLHIADTPECKYCGLPADQASPQCNRH